MSDNDLTLRIRADASQVQSGTDAAKGAVKSLSSSAQSDAAVMAAGFASLNASLRTINQSLVTLTDQTRRAADAAHGLKSYADMGYVIAALGAAFTGLKDIVEGSVWTVSAINHAHDAAIASSIKYAASLGYVTSAVYNLQVANSTLFGRTIGIPVRAIEDLASWAQGLMGISKNTDLALVRTAAMNETLDNLHNTAKSAGLNTASDALSKFVLQLEGIPGVSEQDAAAIERIFLRVPEMSARGNEALVLLTANLSKSKDEALKWAAELSAAMTNPQGAQSLLASLGPETSAAYSKQLAAANEVNDVAHAQAVILEAVAAHIWKAVDGDRVRLEELKKQSAQLGFFGRMAHDIADSWRNVFGSEEVHTTQLRAVTEAADQVRTSVNKLAESMATGSVAAKKYAQDLQTILSTSVPGIKGSKADKTDFDENAQKIAILRTQINGATTDAAKLIQSLESVNKAGFTTPYWDKSANPRLSHWAVGYGQHSVNGQEVTQNSSFSKQEIDQDFTDRIKYIMDRLPKEVGDSWSKLSDAAKAAMASVTYNYGHTPHTVLDAAKTGDNAAVANAILALKDADKGANLTRRATEYGNIMAAEKPLSAQDKEYAQSTLADLSTANLKSTEHDNAGTELENKKFEQLGDRADVDNSINELTEAQERADAAKKDYDNAVAAGATEDEQNARQKTLNEALVEVKTKQVALETAKLDAAIADAKDDPAKLKEAKLAKIEYQQNGAAGADGETHGGYAEGSAEYLAFETQKKEVLREYADNLIRQKIAELDAVIADAKDKDPAKIRDAKIAKANLTETGVNVADEDEDKQMLGGHPEGTQQYIAAEEEKRAAIREFTEYQKKTSVEAEDAAYHNAEQGLAQRKQVLEEEQQDGLITKQEMFAGEQTIEADRAALERTHWTKLKAIWDQGTSQYRDAQKHLEEIDSDSETKRAAITRQSNAEIHADYMKVTEQIANTMSSSIMGMIQGTSSLRSMLRQITLDIIKMFLDAGLKMVANWAAQQLQMVVFSVTGEQEITAAKVLGVAQRTAAGAAGAAADVATTATAIVRSIMSSAAEAFAGVFGFLAPILGPAAVGPATAAMATVSGVANVVAHDVGAWEIPSDHLAIVHQGETIMTASQGAAFRSAMNMISNGTAGGLGSPQKPGGENHFHFNVSSPDASGVQDWFGSNSRQIMKAMNQAVKDGNHLGLRRLAGA